MLSYSQLPFTPKQLPWEYGSRTPTTPTPPEGVGVGVSPLLGRAGA